MPRLKALAKCQGFGERPLAGQTKLTIQRTERQKAGGYWQRRRNVPESWLRRKETQGQKRQQPPEGSAPHSKLGATCLARRREGRLL